MDWLQNALERARERFSTSDEYLLIDDAEVLDRNLIYELWPWGHSARNQRDALMEAGLTSNHSDLPVHFIWLNLFYRLAHYPADDIAVVIEDRENAAEHRQEFSNDLKTLVGLTRDEAANCKDPRRVRWKISNACAVRDWDFAGSLYTHLEELVPTEQKSQVLAMHGRHEFLAVYAPRWEFEEPSLDLWAPVPSSPFTKLMNLCLSLISLQPVGPAGPLSPDEKGRTDCAAYYLARALRGNVDADLLYRCLLLRCRLDLGHFSDAAANCEALLKRRGEFAAEPWKPFDRDPSIVSRLYGLAVDSYEADGRIDLAITASDRWLKECPDESGILERRSRLFLKQGDLDAAYAALRTEVDKNPPRGENPDVSMALRFGELYGTADVQWKRFRRNLDPSEVDRVRSMVTIHWPNASKLDERHFNEWVDGCCLLLKRMPDNPTMAISAFGRLAETELRVRVFERFRATVDAASLPSGEKDPLTNFLRGRGMALEQMLNEIRYRKARSVAGRGFREWFNRERSARLLQRLDLDSLGELNNRAKHSREPFLEWKDAEQMARLTWAFLDLLIGSFTQPSPPARRAQSSVPPAQ